MELIGSKWRDVLSILFQIPYIFGHLTLPLLSYHLRDWRHLELAISIPSLVLISYYWIMPESPYWLFSVGRIDDTVDVLEKIAKCNKHSIELIQSDLQKHASESMMQNHPTRDGYIDLFRTPIMRKYTLCMWFNWLSIGLGFFGVAQYIGQNGETDDIFVNVAISAAIGIPAMIILLIAMKLVGRKWSIILSNVIAGISMLLIIVSDRNKVMLSFIANFGMYIAFSCIYIYLGELFPTVVRSIGLGTGI